MPRNSNVDERVVEMRIDNENFESGANKTISTLERLERALHLKGDTSGLDDVERAVNNFDTSPMTGALEKVQHSFTALEIAGMRVISNLTDSVYNFAAKTVKELTVEPVTMGWDKYGEKTSNVQTIMNATGKSMEEVNKYLADLMWFSDETSFSFTEMTSALSTMTSTGGDIEKLIPLLMGVGNAVAYAGKGSSEFVRTIRNLSQSYSTGYLNLMDWKSLQLAGTNSKALQEALIRSAEEIGKITKGSVTLANFTDSLKDKWADTEVMEKAFGYFSAMSERAKELVDAHVFENATEAYEALAADFDEIQSKAALAAQQAKSFRDMIDAIKDAVSTGWMTTFETIFGNFEQATEFWTEMYDRVYALFGQGGEKRNSLLTYAFGDSSGSIKEATSGMSKLNKYLESAGKSMDDFHDAYAKVITQTNSSYGTQIDRVVRQYGSLEEAMQNGALSADIFRKIMEQLEGGAWTKLQRALNSSGKSMEEFSEAFNKVLSSTNSSYAAQIMQVVSSYGSLEEALKAGAISADLFNQVLKELGIDTEETAEDVEKNVYGMTRSLDDLREVAIQVLRGDFGNGDERRKALEELGYDYEIIQGLASQLSNGNEYLDDETLMEWMELYYAYKNLGEELGAETFEEYLLMQADAAGYAGDEIDSLYDSLTDVVGVEDSIVGHGEEFRKGILNILDAIVKIKEVLTGTEEEAGAFENVFGSIEERGMALGELIHRFYLLTENIGFSEDALKGLQKISEAFLRVIKGAGMIAGGAFKVVGKAVWEVFEILDDILAMIGRGDLTIGGVFDSIVEHLKNIIPTADEVKAAFAGIGEKLKELLPTEEKVLKLWDDLKATFDSIKKSFKDGTVWKDLKNTFEQYIPSLGTITNKFKSLGAYLESKYPNIIKRFDEWREKHSFLADAIDSVRSSFESLGTWLSGLNVDMDGVNETFGQFAAIISTIFGALFGDPKELEVKITALFDTVKKKLKEEFAKFTFSDFLSSLKTAGILVFLSEIISFFDRINNTIETFGSIGDELKGTFKKLGNMFDDIGKSFRANAYLKIAAAIGILALALWGLSKIPEEDLAKAAAAISMVVLAIAVLAKKLNGALKIFGDKNTGNLTGNKITVFSKFASTLIGFGMVVAAIAGLILVARKVDMGKLVGIFAGIGALLLEMSIISYYMAKVQFEDTKGIVGSFLAMALALDLLIPVMVVLAIMPWQKALQAVSGVVFLLAALGLATGLLTKDKLDGKKMLSAAGAMAIMAAALDLLIPILAVLSAMNWAGLGKAAAGIAGALVLLGGALAVMALITSKLGVSGGTLLAIAGAFGIMAIALTILTPAIIAFVGAMIAAAVIVSKIKGFGKAILKLAGIAVVILMFAVAMTVASVALVLFGAAVLLAGVGVVVFAAGLLLLGIALLSLQKSLPVFLDCMETLSNNWKKIAIGVGIFAALAVAMALLAAGLLKLTKMTGLSTFFKNLATAIVNGGKNLLTGILNFIKGLGSNIATFIKDNGDVIVKAIKGVILLVGAFLIGLIPTIVDTVIQALLTLINTIANAIRNNSGAFLHAITNALEALAELVVDALGFILGALAKTLRDMINNLIIGVNNMIIESLKGGGFWTDIAALFGVDVNGLIRNLEEANEQLANAGDEVAASFKETTSGIKDYMRENWIAPDAEFVPTEQTEEAISNMNRMRDAAQEDLSAVQDLNTASLDSLNVTVPAEEGTEAIEKETNALDRFSVMREALANSGIDFGSFGLDLSSMSDTDIEGFFNDLTGRAKEAAGGIPISSGEGVTNNKSFYENALQEMADSGLLSFYQESKDSDYPAAAGDTIMYESADGANDAIDKYMPTTGANAVIGFANEMRANKHYAFSAGQEIGAAADQGTRDYLGVRSPSRLMAQIGGYAAQGLIMGMVSKEGTVYAAGETIGDAMTQAVQKAMSQMALMATDDFAFSPIITPVVDMTNVDGAAGALNSIFGREHHTYINSVIGRAGTISDANTSGSLARSSQYNDNVLGEFHSLSTRLDELGSKIENMQIVLDTGVLVGSTSARMDNQLGKIAARRERAR